MSVVSRIGSYRIATSALSGVARVSRAIIAATAVTLVSTMPAASQMSFLEWPRLPDGRVLIDVKGLPLALPTNGSDLEDVRFDDQTFDMRKRMTLRKVIDQVAAARTFFAQAEYITVSLPNLSERGGLFLGHYPREDFKIAGFSLAIGGRVANICKSAEASEERMQKALDSVPLDEKSSLDIDIDGLLSPIKVTSEFDGWVQFEFKNGSKYHIQRGTSMTSRFNQVVCLDSDCSVSLCLTPSASFDFKFSLQKYSVSSWKSLIQRTNDVANYVTNLSDR